MRPSIDLTRAEGNAALQEKHPFARRGFFSGFVVALSILHWIILVFHIPVLTWIVWWFWKFTDTPLEALWIAPCLAAILLIWLKYSLPKPEKNILMIAGLIVLGYAMQMGFGYIEGRGIDGIRYRMVTSGHSAFAQYAVMQDSLVDTIRNYEEKLEEFDRRGLDTWGRSKPPGTLLLYMLTDRLANAVTGPRKGEERLHNLRTLASYLWPLLSYLVLFPLYLFTSRYVNRDAGFMACVLYILIPSVTLMPLHTDQTFFPLFAMVALYLSAVAAERNSTALGIVSGVWCYLILFSTFSLLFIIPLILLTPLGMNVQLGWLDRLRLIMKQSAIFLGGFVGCDLLFRFLFSYDIIARFQGAMHNHVSWKHWDFSFFHVSHSAAINLIEFALWVGIPVTLLASHRVYRSMKGFNPYKMDVSSTLSLGLLLVVIALNILGQAKGETARLWLFLVPFVCVIAAHSLIRLERTEGRFFVSVVLTSQWITILLTKMNQDFY